MATLMEKDSLINGISQTLGLIVAQTGSRNEDSELLAGLRNKLALGFPVLQTCLDVIHAHGHTSSLSFDITESSAVLVVPSSVSIPLS